MAPSQVLSEGRPGTVAILESRQSSLERERRSLGGNKDSIECIVRLRGWKIWEMVKSENTRERHDSDIKVRLKEHDFEIGRV